MPVERKRSRPVTTWRSSVNVGSVSALLVVLAVPAALVLLAREPDDPLTLRQGVVLLAAALIALLDGNLHMRGAKTLGTMLFHWVYAIPVGLIALLPLLGKPGLMLLPGATGLMLAAALAGTRFLRSARFVR